MTSLISRAKKVLRFLADREGTTAVEYAMMVMLVFLAVLSVVTYFGQSTAENLQDPRSSLQEALDPGS